MRDTYFYLYPPKPAQLKHFSQILFWPLQLKVDKKAQIEKRLKKAGWIFQEDLYHRDKPTSHDITDIEKHTPIFTTIQSGGNWIRECCVFARRFNTSRDII